MRVPSLARALAVLGILLAFVDVRPAEAQTGKITGVVTDAANGQPIEGVQVLLAGTGRGTVTGSNGRYFVLSVPPGDYTVIARRIGYQSAETRGVQVRIDVTTDVNFRLSSSASTLQAVKIEAASQPLILPGNTGTRTAITAEEIDALPVNSIAGVLALQPGFLSVPTDNPDVTSFLDERRGTSLLRIRGGRASETLTLIDGIPVNNFLHGGPGVDLNTDVINQLDYVRGGFEAQYGNAMSGILNMATKEGGTDLKGSVRYSTSRFAGSLGSRPDEVRGYDFIAGWMSGPVPGTREKLRWMFSGRQSAGAAQTLQFDDVIFNPFSNRADLRGNTASIGDLFPGWRAVGFTQSRDVFAKATYYFTSATKLNVGFLDFMSQGQQYNPAFGMAGYDPAEACARVYPDKAAYCFQQYRQGDPLRFEDVLVTQNGNLRAVQEYTIQGSTRTNRDLAWFNLNTTRGRANLQLRGGRLRAARAGCNFLTGICLGDKIRNFTTAQDFALGQFTPFSRHGDQYANPGAATENYAGGDTNTTYSLRGDLQSQVTDHHNLQAGVFFQRHDLRFYEAQNVTKPFDQSRIVNYVYGGQPWDAAVYLQDRVEYDFLTIKMGLRFDYTHAPGRFFVNPRDPTNGTTATEVCQGTAFGSTPYVLRDPAGNPILVGGQQVTGLAACNSSPTLRDSATRVATGDDFADSPLRTQFSPRLGVQFPLTERSSFFANWGIYTQNPTYHAMYVGTGIGRVTDTTITDSRGISGLGNTIARGTSLEGTIYGPNFRNDNGFVPLVGNPRLEIERTSSYEVGFQSEFGRNFAFTFTGYAKDQSGLTGVKPGGFLANGQSLLDFGQTYNPAGTGLVYNVLVNGDYQTVRGIETTLRRRLANYWAFAVQYAYQQSTTNAAPPELEIQKRLEGDVAVRKEIPSETDQPHLFTSELRFAVEEKLPQVRFANVLRNSRLTFTTRAASGLPYTPEFSTARPGDFNTSLQRGERNSGRAPTTWTVDMLAEKAVRLGNLRYSGFLQVNNMLDRKNCVAVYTTTGNCESGALSASRLYVGARQGGATPTISLQSGSSTIFDRPQMIGARRSILSGIRVSF